MLCYIQAGKKSLKIPSAIIRNTANVRKMLKFDNAVFAVPTGFCFTAAGDGIPGKTFSKASITAAQQSVIQYNGFQLGFHSLITLTASSIALCVSSDTIKLPTTWCVVSARMTIKNVGREYFVVLYTASNVQRLFPYWLKSLF